MPLLRVLLCLIFAMTTTGLFASPEMKPKTLIIGHRGASFEAPENTVAAFRLAAEQGDGFELDLRSTQDGKIIVIHDATTKRVAGVDLKVSEQTFGQLRALEVAQWGKWKGGPLREKLPTVEESLQALPPGKHLLLHGYTELAHLTDLKEPLFKSGKDLNLIHFIHFELPHCVRFKEVMPQCKTFWLRSYGKDKEKMATETAPWLIAKCKAAGVDGVDLESVYPIDQTFVAAFHAAGLQVHVWTVDDPALAAHLTAAGVDSITTNRPDLLKSK